MTSVLDVNDEKGAKALRMLEEDLIGWITTIAKDGTPRAVPVWFWWEDGRIHVLSEPKTGKVAHIRRGSPVLFHLEAGGPFGDDVVILHGSAEIASESTAQWLAPRRDAYIAKYADAIEAYGMGVDEMADTFSTMIVFTPERAQTW